MKKILLLLIVLLIPSLAYAKTYEGISINDGNYFYKGDIIKNIKGLPFGDFNYNFDIQENSSSYLKSNDNYKYPEYVDVRYFVIDHDVTENIVYKEITNTSGYASPYSFIYTNTKGEKIIAKPNSYGGTNYEAMTSLDGYEMVVADFEDSSLNTPNRRWYLKQYNLNNDSETERCLELRKDIRLNQYEGQGSSCFYGYTTSQTMTLDFYEAEQQTPEFKLTCDKNELKLNETTSCKIELSYEYEVNEISFKIDVKNTEINNLVLNDYWELKDGVLSFEADTKEKQTYAAGFKNGISIGTLDIKYIDNSKNDTTTENDTLKIILGINDIELTDAIDSVTVDDKEVEITVLNEEKSSTTGAKVEEENPGTGIYDFTVIALTILIGASCLYYKYKGKRLFRKI